MLEWRAKMAMGAKPPFTQVFNCPGFIVNSLWFNLYWFSAVVGQSDWLVLPISLMLLHLWWVRGDKGEWVFIASVALLGTLVDSLLSVLGVFQFESGILAPLWLTLLWAGFAATIRHSLTWLANSPWLAAAFGAFGGTTSYLAGARLGAVDFGLSTLHSLIILVCVWAILLPLIFRWNRWLQARLPASVQEESA